jgi:ubiquinone/menaquinone biosynthesis C-methylase UbiE
MSTHRTYLPAAGHDWALPLYDPLTRLLGGERTRQAFIDQARLPSATRVLDVGCGTGTLAVLIAHLYPHLQVVGLDPDRRALARANLKADDAAVPVQFDRGFADALSYPDASFDRLFSSFMLHHLDAGEKAKALREAKRVLRPGGSLHLLDFAPPAPGTAGRLIRWLHANHRLTDNTEERVMTLMRDVGFSVARVASRDTMFVWRLSYYEAHQRESQRATI